MFKVFALLLILPPAIIGGYLLSAPIEKLFAAVAWMRLPIPAKGTGLYKLLVCFLAVTATAASKEPFLKQRKSVPPRHEWNREIVSKKGGTFRFRVSSPEPFGVTLLADRSYRALQRRDAAGIQREDLLLTTDCGETVFEMTVQVKPGKYWFILENQSDKKVEMELECTEVKDSIEPAGSENGASPRR